MWCGNRFLGTKDEDFRCGTHTNGNQLFGGCLADSRSYLLGLPAHVQRHRGWQAHPTNHRTLHVRLAVYGTPLFDREHFRNVFRSHRALVFSQFEGRPGKLLSLNATAGEGWEQLCPFLDKSIPDQPYPHVRTKPKEWQYMGEAPDGYRD